MESIGDLWQPSCESCEEGGERKIKLMKFASRLSEVGDECPRPLHKCCVCVHVRALELISSFS